MGPHREQSWPLSCSPCTLQTYPVHSHLENFSDNSAIIALIREGGNRAYREHLKDFVDWCQQNHIQLNTRKTKQSCAQVNIQGTDIEMVTSYKYLGVHMNNKLDWTDHTAATYRKGQSRLHLAEEAQVLGMEGALLTTLYDSVVALAIFYGLA